MSKLTLYVVIACQSLLMSFASGSMGQRKHLEEIPIELEIGNGEMPLSKLINQIEANNEFQFAYAKSDIRGKSITLSKSSYNMQELLREVSLQARFSIRRVNETIALITLKEDVTPSVTEEINNLQQSVSGTITDENGEPLPGATIQEKGTTNGTITSADGNYTLQVADNSILTISFVGFQTQEVPLNGRTSISVQLVADVSALEEVVVVGYGTQKKSDLVGSVASIPSEKLEKNSNPNLFQALQAAAPGVNLQRGNGEPGTSGSLRIRGVTSITASNSPLIIFDGIPWAGDIRDINPNDIASVEILKDASAAAVYGSRAANGVILITSKSGVESGTIVELNTAWSFQNEAVPFELMGPDEFFEYRREGYRAAGLLDGVDEADVPATILEQNELISYQRGESVDWMDEMINQNAMIQNYQVSVRTGNKTVKDYFSVSFNEEEGLQRTTGFSRLTLKNNVEMTGIADWLTLGDNLTYSYNDFERREFSLNNQPAYYRLSPFARIYEDDGSFTKHPQANDDLFINPIAEDELTARENNFNHFFNNFYFILKPSIIDGLSFKMNMGTTLRNTYNASYLRRGTFLGDQLGGVANVGGSKVLDLTWENILNYSRNFSGHSIGITGLFSRQFHKNNSWSTRSSGFVSDDYLWHSLEAGEQVGVPNSNLVEWNLLSYMARLTYDYKGKYYLTATGRRDGYSGFAANNKYGFFPSFAVAWRLTSEPFMNGVVWLDDLKLRASYGSLGNQAVGTYNSLARLGLAQHIFGEELVTGLRATSLPNKDLSWETTKTLNLATDVSLFEGRLSATLEYYKASTFDILLSRSIPAMTGQNSVIFNIGEVQNTGYEALISGTPVVIGDFNWKVNVNFSRNINEIVDLYGDGEDDIGNQWFIGEPLGIIYGEEANGIYQLGDEDEILNSATPDRSPGDVRLVDQNNDGTIDDQDRIILGYTQPEWIGGIYNSFTWKGLSLDIFIQTVQGVDKRYNPEGAWSGRVNRPPVDYWTPENPSNTWFRPNQNNIPNFGSINLFDASFTRVKDITLSYALPASLLDSTPLSNVRVFVNFHDYFTFTKYPFIDPEISGGYNMSIPKYFQTGFNVTF